MFHSIENHFLHGGSESNISYLGMPCGLQFILSGTTVNAGKLSTEIHLFIIQLY